MGSEPHGRLPLHHSVPITRTPYYAIRSISDLPDAQSWSMMVTTDLHGMHSWIAIFWYEAVDSEVDCLLGEP